MPKPPDLYINEFKLRTNFLNDFPQNPRLAELSRSKRKAGYLPEVLFWQQVHKGKFHNIDFDRQRNIGNYIVDFYVKYLGLVVEIDGSSHDGREEYDEIRENYLKSFGIRVYRISNQDILNRLDFAMKDLEEFILLEYSAA